MAGMIVKNPLKDKESFIGRVSDVLETSVVLEDANEKKYKLLLPKEVLEAINDDHNGMFGGDIIKITNKAGEYEIEELEDFPKG